MIFEEILRAVDELNDNERRLLRLHIDRRSNKPTQLTPKERMRRLNAALDAMGDGLIYALARRDDRGDDRGIHRSLG